MTNRCFSVLCDVICVAFSLAVIYASVSSVIGQVGLEKASPSLSGSGFHLLSCPKLFRQQQSAEDFKSKYSDIHLNKESTDKLMNLLNESLLHAHVLKTGKDHPKHAHKTITDAVEEQIGEGQQVDINVPRKSDNAHLCHILENILDEQAESEKSSGQLQQDDPHVTISIMKLETKDVESPLLRGARLIRNSPIVDQVLMKMITLDGRMKEFLQSAKDVLSKDIMQIA
jgi:hypothetical protein